LQRRISTLEEISQFFDRVYVLKCEAFGFCDYWIIRQGERPPKSYGKVVGTFENRKDANNGRLRDLQISYPRAYEQLLRNRSAADFEEDEILSVDTTTCL